MKKGWRVEKEVIYGLMQPVVSEQLFNIVSGGLWLADRRIKMVATAIPTAFKDLKRINVHV